MSVHIGAKQGDIADTVLLPGDPLRAKFVAENLMDDAVQYNNVRGMLGFTGTYKGKRVSIQGSGMGMGSLSIYVNELISNFGVKNVIRVGTCGAIQKSLTLGQVILAHGASGDSGANRYYFGGLDYSAIANFDLLMEAYQVAKSMKINTIQGNIFSTNTFYDDNPNRWEKWIKHKILAVEMESQMLYTLAARLGARGLSILTVSDNIITGESSSSEEREKSYVDMMKIALEIA